MITPVTVPKLTITMEGGNLIRWLKQEGDSVEKDDLLFELETDKAVVEVPSPAEGILRKIVVPEGQVSVGAILAFIGDVSDVIPEVKPGSVSQPPAPAGVSVPHTPEAVRTEPRVIRATPAAKRRAKELGVDLANVHPTGPEGRVTQEDVERVAAELSSGVPVAAAALDLRSIIAQRMTNAWRTVPHIHIGGELQATGLRQALAKAKQKVAAHVTLTDLLLFAVASLLPKFPALGTVWHEGKPVPLSQVHLAFAVETDRGVVAPVIRDASRLSLEQISLERKRLVEAALAHRLKLSEVEGGTFTLTNLGMFPVDFFVPIINYPQSAILATGRVRDQVRILDGVPQAVPYLWVNLAVDHRVADGAVAAEFLRELEKVFEALDLRVG